MNKVNKIFLVGFLVIFVLFIFVYLLNNSYSYLDPDFGWHLKVGQDILAAKDAPRTNLYNYPLFNEEWINHEWLTDLSMYLIYDYLSYFYLHLFFALLILGTLWISLLSVFRKYNFWTSFFASLLFIILGVTAAQPSLGVRPQELALFFTALVIYLLNKNKYLWLSLSLIFLLWANLHGSYILALGLVLAWQSLAYLSTQNFFKQLLSKFNLEFKNFYKKSNWLLLPLLFAITLINPYGLSLYKSLGEYSNSFYLKHILEWLPQFVFPILYWQLIFLTLSWTFFVIYYYEKYRLKDKIDVWQVFLFLFFFVLALKSKRHLPLFFIVNLALLTEIFIYFSKQLKDFKPNRLGFRINILLSSLILVIFSYSLFTTLNYYQNPFVSFCNKYPCQAIHFLKNNEATVKDLNIYNNYGWGGFMIWEYPQRKIFIDGRMPHYSYKGKSYLEEYYKLFNNEEDFLTLVEEYKIGIFLLNKNTKSISPKKFETLFFYGSGDYVSDNKFKLAKYLENSAAWNKLYEDNVAIIYIKNYEFDYLPAD